MPTLPEIVRSHTGLEEADVDWLQLLMADWQIVSDLSFADLVLWLPDREGKGFWAAGQIRPTTGPTAYVDDVIGTFVPSSHAGLDDALTTGRIVRSGDPIWNVDMPVRVESIPVKRDDAVIAVISRDTNLHGVRTPSKLELTYMQTADELAQMIAGGSFPNPAQRGDHTDTPRVGDGFVRVDADGLVDYASPNALSSFRRLGLSGDLAGSSLAGITRQLVPARLRVDEETLSAVLGGRAYRDAEIGTEGVSLVARSIPLGHLGERIGAVVLVRDVTDLRRRDRELVTKDATIREIHHRVKNNLQTVAALLRMQGRRIQEPEAKSALAEAVRRVGSIALVHEILSQQPIEETVEFDEIADRLGAMVVETTSVGASVRVVREGSYDALPSEVATPLAMVVTELLQNAVEHGYPQGTERADTGLITVRVQRQPQQLVVTIEDDGLGLPDDFDLESSPSLGLNIVRTLVESELNGTIEIGPRDDAQGARAGITLPLE